MKKKEKTERTSEKKKERVKKTYIPGIFFDSFGLSSPAFNLPISISNLRLFIFRLELILVDLTVEVVAACPASFGWFVGVGLSAFASFSLSCWLLVAVRPCVARHGGRCRCS
jgi:hypothetical protein